MMSTIFTLSALAISALFIAYLSVSDPKRRRVYGLANWGTKRYTKEAWCMSLLPGFILITLQSYAAFIMWMAAMSLVGWLIALPKPVAASRQHHESK
jgi:hypothetical protein